MSPPSGTLTIARTRCRGRLVSRAALDKVPTIGSVGLEKIAAAFGAHQ